MKRPTKNVISDKQKNTMRAGINTFQIPSDVERICVRIGCEFISQEHFLRMCIHIWPKINYCEKREVCVSNLNQRRSEFFTYVHVFCICNSGSKTKECTWIFPVGIVTRSRVNREVQTVN